MTSHASSRLRVLALVFGGVLSAATAGAQVRPAMIGKVLPPGLQRGTTLTLTVEGTNLAGASAVLFEDEGIGGRIVTNEDVGPDVVEPEPEATRLPVADRARKHRMTVEVTVGPDVRLGRHSFRLLTPLGTTNPATVVVGRLAEASEAEPNDPPAAAQVLALPVTVNGALEKENDVDRYRFEAKAGQQLVFEVVASGIGSKLDSVLTLIDAGGRLLARSDDFRGRTDAFLAHRFNEAGTFVLQVSDAANGGSPQHFYRLTAGELPYVTDVFPLGVRRGSVTTVSLEGFNLGAESVTVDATGLGPEKDRLRVPVASPLGEPLNMVEVVLDDQPEVSEREPNDATRAQPIPLPVTVNGRIQRTGGGPDEDVFRFRALKGQTLLFTVMAARLGSRLDSVLEVLDGAGRPVPRATLRPVWQTTVDLRDHDSNGTGIRLLAWSGIQSGDFLYIDRELIRVRELPGHPDADTRFEGFRGRRLSFEETTPEGHALNTPVYKVEVHPPGTRCPAGGLAPFTLHYRNDDGGYTLGKDSRLTFTAPATGEYRLCLRDSRGLSGPEFAYRLTVAEPQPDFRLFVGTPAPNVPRGGRVPISVAVERRDGFDGPVDVATAGLPEGLTATPVTVLPGSTAVTLTLAAADGAEVKAPSRFRVVGRAQIRGQVVEREAMMDAPAALSLASVVGPPELLLASVEPQVIELPAGSRAKVTVRIRRAGGFAGRVPVDVENLPLGVHIPDIGLNGVLITEAQESRDFYLEADPHAPLQEQRLFLTGRVETNSFLPTDQASEPVLLKVVPKRTAANP